MVQKSEGMMDAFVCPLTHRVMEDPVVAIDGYSYERSAFESWLSSGRRTSPATGLYLAVTSVVPNRALQRAIKEALPKLQPQLQESEVKYELEALAIVEDAIREESPVLKGRSPPQALVDVLDSVSENCMLPPGHALLVAGGAMPEDENDCCAALVSVLRRNMMDRPVCRAALQALIRITIDKGDGPHARNRVRLASMGAWEVACKVAETYLISPEMIRCCATLILHLSREGIRPHQAESVCQSLVDVARVYPDDLTITRAACGSMWNLVLDPLGVQHLARAGACVDVLSALRTFPDDNDVLRFACGALAGLASDASCSRAMGEAGACELVMDVLARSLEDVNVTETACWSVYNLSLVDPANRTKLVLLGVRNVLVQANKRWVGHDAIQRSTSQTLVNLRPN